MHEIAMLTERRSALDDAELERARGAGADRRRPGRPSRRRGRRSCRRSLVAEDGGGAGRGGDRRRSWPTSRPRHDGLRAAVDAGALATLRRAAQPAWSPRRRSTVSRCEGCHLDLSAVEIDAVRAECGRRRARRLPALRPAARSSGSVFFWFIGTAVVTVWFVFRDPRFDYRLLIVGSVLPAVVDALFGGARVLHSLMFSVVLLAVLMLATPRGTPIRRTLLALPIGTLLHLVFTGAWIEPAGVLVAVPGLVVRGRIASRRRRAAGGTCCSS